MKIKEIVEMSTDELMTKRRDLRQERLHLRLQQQSGQLEQPTTIPAEEPKAKKKK
jgi:large subunit ribosomal protein L29